jgi:hypothetical protein
MISERRIRGLMSAQEQGATLQMTKTRPLTPTYRHILEIKSYGLLRIITYLMVIPMLLGLGRIVVGS